ncbi:hypothetical protein R5R35_003992 [Gryllus longicercus]|uniref:Aquaporin n=1 Tax=Gryllus longicercus TaxID=2509291 RepID=A0AAN9VYX0_9ORTH
MPRAIMPAVKPYAYLAFNTHHGDAGLALAVPSCAVSAGVLAVTLLLAEIARRLVNRITEQGSLLSQLLHEVVAAGELCACCFELCVIADNYGVWVYAVCLWALTVWWGTRWGSATACPYIHYEDVVEGNTDVVTALLKTAAQLGGGFAIYNYIQYIWELELAETHIDKADEDCVADLHVTMFQGAGIEGAATCVARVASRIISQREIPLGNYIDAFVGTSMVIAAFDLTGGYLNPILASSLKYDCEGNTFEEHVIVYWVGATLGAIASIYLANHPTIQKLLGKPKAD